MKDLLRPLKDHYEKNDDFKRKMDTFVRVQKTPDWEFFTFMLRSAQGVMVNHMLTAHFTNLSQEEKDVFQRTYYNTNQMIEFFLNPLKGMEKRKKWNKPTKQVEPSS